MSAPWVASGARILSPGIIADINLGGRVEGVHAGFAIAAEHNGPDVAGPHSVVFHHVGHAGDQLFHGVVHVNPVDLGRIQQALVFFSAKDGGTGGQGVATDSLKYRGGVVDRATSRAGWPGPRE